MFYSMREKSRSAAFSPSLSHTLIFCVCHSLSFSSTLSLLLSFDPSLFVAFSLYLFPTVSFSLLFHFFSIVSTARFHVFTASFLITDLTFFPIFSGECWLTTIALDLVQSLTNPFTSYKGNMKRYQIMVWTFSLAISFIFFFNTDCQGRFDHGICWVRITSTHSPCLWGYFLFWIVCMYAYQMWASVFAYMRLRQGLPLTFEIRKQCAVETFKCLSVYAAYLSLMMFFFAIISSLDPNPPIGSSLNNFSLFLLFVIANRGSVDGVVWFMLHDFMRDVKKDDRAIDLDWAEEGKIDNNDSGDKSSSSGNILDLDRDREAPPLGRVGRRPSIFAAPMAGTRLDMLNCCCWSEVMVFFCAVIIEC